MIPKTPNAACLTTVRYVPDKNEIAAEFSNCSDRFTLRERFFPSLSLPSKGLSTQDISSLILASGTRRFSLSDEESRIRITAGSFDDLKKIHSMLQNSLNLSPLLIEPERQFLLKKGWSYFDSFEIEGSIPKKLSSFALPDAGLDFLPGTVKDTIAYLLIEDSQAAERLTRQLILSKVLSLPLQFLPEANSQIAERFFESIFFKHNVPLPAMQAKPGFTAQKSSAFSGSAKSCLDFSPIWPLLISYPFFNLGNDTLNCDCCKPHSLDASNLLPNSRITARFLLHGYYFESCSEEFSQEFHESSQNKASRLGRKAEFCLKSIPIGPTEKGSIAQIPLADLAYLKLQGIAAVSGSTHNLLWTCRKKESFLSAEISSLNKSIAECGKIMNEIFQSAMKGNRLNYSALLSRNPEYFYAMQHKAVLSELLEHIPVHLLSPSSRFYSREIADAIKTLQSKTLLRFREFSAESGVRCLAYNRYRTYLNSRHALLLANSFSKTENLPAPKVRGR